MQPVNDAPVMNIPSFVVLGDSKDGVQIFGEKYVGVDFIHDPDLHNFPGNSFLVI